MVTKTPSVFQLYKNNLGTTSLATMLRYCKSPENYFNHLNVEKREMINNVSCNLKLRYRIGIITEIYCTAKL